MPPPSVQTSPTSAASPPVTAPAVVVSTNEPFWQARVENGTILLTGVDAAPRRLLVERVEDAGVARRITGRDAAGTVAIIVRNRACTDDMSGTRFPQSGSIAFGDAPPIRGCARPPNVRPQPAVDASRAVAGVIPARFRGRWAPTATACTASAATIEDVTVEAGALRWHESIGVPAAVAMAEDGGVALTLDYEGEGERWRARQSLHLSDDGRLVILGPAGQRRSLVRCELTPPAAPPPGGRPTPAG